MARTPMNEVPRFLRFARALALTSGVGASAAGCYAVHERPGGDGGSGGTDARVLADAGPDARLVPVDAPVVATCETCTCSWVALDAGTPSCETLGRWECCAAVGPLAPPDLPA